MIDAQAIESQIMEIFETEERSNACEQPSAEERVAENHIQAFKTAADAATKEAMEMHSTAGLAARWPTKPCQTSLTEKTPPLASLSGDTDATQSNPGNIIDDKAFLSDPMVYRLTILNLGEDYAREDQLRSVCQQFGPIHLVTIENSGCEGETHHQKFVGIADYYRLNDAVVAKDKLLELKGWKIFFSAEKKKDLRTLYVSNFPKHFNHNDLRLFLEESGKIRSVRVFGLGQPTMIAFVTCENVFEAKKILALNNGRRIGDTKKMLKVKYANVNHKKKSVNVHGISGDFCTPPPRPDGAKPFSTGDIFDENFSVVNSPSKYNASPPAASHGDHHMKPLSHAHSFEELRRVSSVNSLNTSTSNSFTAVTSTNSADDEVISAADNSLMDKICLDGLNVDYSNGHPIGGDNDCRLVDSLLDSGLLKNSKMGKAKSSSSSWSSSSKKQQQPSNLNLFLAVTINGIPALIPANYAVSMKVIPETMLKKKGWIAKPIILNRKYDDYCIYTGTPNGGKISPNFS